MARTIYNHRRRILNLQPAIHKALYPGMIVQFKYIGENIFDKLPIVLVVWNDYTNYKIHGINLNYINETTIKRIFEVMMKGGKSVKDDISLTQEDQDADDYDNTLPNRNLLTEPYTRLKLPTFREIRDGQPISKSEAQIEMKRLYDRYLKRFVKQQDMYRSYSYKKMQTVRVIQYNIEGLLK